MPDADVEFHPHFIALSDSKALAEILFKNIVWRQDTLTMYGKVIDIPRLQAWYGDDNTDYSYSGLSLTPLPWFDELFQLKQQIETFIQCPFNSVLANCYRDNNDSVGWHSDDEPELGEQPVIASLSLGGERVFHFKHKITKASYKLSLPSGSLLIMRGNTQKYWQHAVLKSRIQTPRRINLTFRKIIK